MVRVASTDAMLTVWEQAYSLGSAGKGLMLLALANEDESLERLKSLSVGQRDAALLRLRSQLFGQDLVALSNCPQCGEIVEIFLTVDQLLLPGLDDTPSRTLVLGGRQFTLVSLNSHDLLAAEAAGTPDARRRQLLCRCLNSIDDPAAVECLAESDAREVAQHLADLDPQADLRLAIACTRCRQEWSSRFDIVAFLWRELDAWALRLLADIHSLASAYGWAERDILALSPWRRQIYLEMLRQ